MLKKLFLENTSTGQTILKNTFWLLFAEIISKGSLFFLIIWITRYLGVEGYGKFSFAFAFVSLFAILADFGFSTLTVREATRDKSKTKKYINNIIIIKLILGAITLALIILIVQLLDKSPEVKTLVYLAGIFTITQSFIQFFYAIFRVYEKMEFQAFSKIIYSFLLFIIVSFALWKQLELKDLIIAYIIADILTLLLTFLIVWKKFTKFKLEMDLIFWKKILNEAWPFALSAVFISIYYYMDSVMLSIMRDDQAVGLYNAAYKPIIFIVFIAGAFLNSTLPIISRLYKESTKKLKNILNFLVKFMAGIAIPLAFGGTILAHKIINLLYGPEYREGTLAFQILIWTSAIIYTSVIYCNILQGCNKQKIYLRGTALGALVNTIANFILITYFSLNGASIATLIAELTVFIYIYYQVNKFISVKIFYHLLKPFLAAIAMSLVLYFIININLFILIFIGIIVYTIFMYIIKGITKQDIVRLKNLLYLKKS